jgi:cyclopropane fatty-acyl-phospholipid synthase-like methyltransferase
LFRELYERTGRARKAAILTMRSRPDGYFDLVYAISVFTHITHEWSAWLLELHRILKPEGLLLATFCGPEPWGKSVSSPPDENGARDVCAKARAWD